MNGSKSRIATAVLLAGVAQGAYSQEWNPSGVDLEPLTSVSQRMKEAQLFLYLDKDCNRLAVVAPMPETNEGNAFVPDLSMVRAQDRLRTMPEPQKCAKTPNKWKPLRDVNSGGSDTTSRACDPRTAVPTDDSFEAERASTSCMLDTAEVQFLVILDSSRDPILMIEGQSARRASPPTIPSRLLAFQRGDPSGCSPVTPTPCPPPRTGKFIGNPPTCICSF